MRPYVAERLKELGAYKPPAPPKVRAPRKLKVPNMDSLAGHKANLYVRSVRRTAPDASTWFNVAHAYVAGWNSGQGELLSTLRIDGPTLSFITILRRQAAGLEAAGLEADGLKRSACLLNQAADELHRNYREQFK